MIRTGGEGKVPPRKRMRGKIGNPSSAPELKTHNLLRADTDTNVTFYDGALVKGVYTNSDNGVWYPIVCNWPVVGTGAHQRIGNKIRVRLLRLKGYVSYTPYLITQVRYRIVLYRCKKVLNFTHVQWLAPMYSAFADIANSANVDAKQNACSTDFYAAFFNKTHMKQNEIKRRVLFRGMIKPQQDIGNFTNRAVQWTGEIAPGEQPTVISSTSNTTGKHWGKIWQRVQQGTLYESNSYFNNDENTVANPAPDNVALASGTSTALHHLVFQQNQPVTTYYGVFQWHYNTPNGFVYDAYTAGNQRGFFPIDITVNMNDNVDCEEYRYVFVVESDWCIGQDPSGDFSNAEANSNFFFHFIPHIYYTDD